MGIPKGIIFAFSVFILVAPTLNLYIQHHKLKEGNITLSEFNEKKDPTLIVSLVLYLLVAYLFKNIIKCKDHLFSLMAYTLTLLYAPTIMLYSKIINIENYFKVIAPFHTILILILFGTINFSEA